MDIQNINGFNVAHKKFDGDVVNARIVINAGSQLEDEEDFGVAHYLEHMFFKGTEKRNYKEINKATARLGDVNAYTSYGKTVYHFTFLQKDLKEALETLVEMVFHPAFPKDEFTKEKTVILEELQMYLDDPHSSFYWHAYHHLYGKIGHPIVGTLESVKGLSLDNLNKFHKRYYTPSNILVSITGAERKEVDKILSNILPKELKDEKAPDAFNDEMNFDDYHFTHKAKQAAMGVWYRAEGMKDYWNNKLVADILCNGLGGGMHSLLFDRLREELGLCYSVFANNNCFTQDFGSVCACIFLDENNIDTAQEEMAKIIEKVKQEGFSNELLEIAKKNTLFSLAKWFESKIAFNAIMGDKYFDNGCKFISYDERKNMIESLTNKDIATAANRIFDNDPKLVIMTQEK